MKIFLTIILVFVLSTSLIAQDNGPPDMSCDCIPCAPLCDPDCMALNGCTMVTPITGGVLYLLVAAGIGLGIIKKKKK